MRRGQCIIDEGEEEQLRRECRGKMREAVKPGTRPGRRGRKRQRRDPEDEATSTAAEGASASSNDPPAGPKPRLSQKMFLAIRPALLRRVERGLQDCLEVTEEEAVNEYMLEVDGEFQTECAARQREQLAKSAVEKLIREKVLKVAKETPDATCPWLRTLEFCEGVDPGTFAGSASTARQPKGRQRRPPTIKPISGSTIQPLSGPTREPRQRKTRKRVEIRDLLKEAQRRNAGGGGAGNPGSTTTTAASQGPTKTNDKSKSSGGEVAPTARPPGSHASSSSTHPRRRTKRGAKQSEK